MANILAEKSLQTWQEGKECLVRGHINAATNRIYYSVFQAVKGFAINQHNWTVDTSENVHGEALKIVGGQGGQGRFWRRRLNELLGLRIIADYKAESVKPNELEELLTDADSMRKHYIRLAGGEK